MFQKYFPLFLSNDTTAIEEIILFILRIAIQIPYALIISKYRLIGYFQY